MAASEKIAQFSLQTKPKDILRPMNHTSFELTTVEREHFLEHGYVLLQGAFSRDFALDEVHKQFQANGMDAQRPETWREPLMHLPATQSWPLGEIAPRLQQAAWEILGGQERVLGSDWFNNDLGANCFAGEGKPWRAPDEYFGWHKDGYFFRHFLDSPEQALLALPLWTDVVPQGGGTFIAPGSQKVVARFLADHPEGVHPNKFPWSDLVRQCPNRIEAVGRAGDVYLMHGYMLHTVSLNPNRKLRCIANDIFALKEPLQFNRQDGQYSLLELSVLKALEVESYDFQPTRERLSTPDHTELPNELI